MQVRRAPGITFLHVCFLLGELALELRKLLLAGVQGERAGSVENVRKCQTNQPEVLLCEFHFRAGRRRQQNGGISSSTWPTGFATSAFVTLGTGSFFVVGSDAVPSSHILSLPLQPRGDAGGRHQLYRQPEMPPGIAIYLLEGRITCSRATPIKPYRTSGHRYSRGPTCDFQGLIHFTQAHLPIINLTLTVDNSSF